MIADHIAHLADCFRHHGDAVGPHIGDQTDGLAADIDALIEFLCRLHGARGGEAELARRFLLQRRRGEGRRRIALGRLGFHTRDGEGGRIDRIDGGVS